MKNKKLFLKIFSIFCLIAYLLIPVKFVQALALTFLFVYFFSLAYSKIVSDAIRIERPISKVKLASQEHAKITITIKNYSFLPVFVCYVYDFVSTLYVFNNKNRHLFFLRPHEIKKMDYEILAQDRGEFEIGPVKIQVRDPLNLFPFELEIPSTAKITIRPKRINLSVNPLASLPQGLIDIKNPCYEDITMRRSIREYKSGDEIKRINWRAFAKYGSIFTNEYEDTFDAPFFVFLNLAEDDYELPTRFYKTERAIEIAAAIVEKAESLHQRCGFACYGTNFPFIKPNNNQKDFILDLLAVIKMESGKITYDPEKKYKPQLPNGTLFFTVGPKEVDLYDVKTNGNKKNITTNQLGMIKKI